MALSKEYLRSKVIQGIEVMPSNGIVVREILNKYEEKEFYQKVTELKGVLYNKKADTKIILKDIGEVIDEVVKCYLVDYNDFSKLVNIGDYIFINDTCYKVISLGEEFEVYFEFNLKEHHLVLDEDLVKDNDEIYTLY